MNDRRRSYINACNIYSLNNARAGNYTDTTNYATYKSKNVWVQDSSAVMTDPANGDYTYTAGATAWIDSGDPTSSATTDYYGDSRPYNTDYDIGHDEYTSLVPSTFPLILPFKLAILDYRQIIIKPD